MRAFHRDIPAPGDDRRIGLDVLGVPGGSPISLDVRLESVTEGVYVSGTVSAPLVGECSRCLDELTDHLTVDIGELFAYPHSATDETTDVDELRGSSTSTSTSSRPCATPWCSPSRWPRSAPTTAPACAPSAGERGPTSGRTTGMRHWILDGPRCVTRCCETLVLARSRVLHRILGPHAQLVTPYYR